MTLTMTTTQAPVTLKDLRASERLIERAKRQIAKLAMALTVAEQAVSAEHERHDALVETYRRQIGGPGA
mgnify:FL=1